MCFFIRDRDSIPTGASLKGLSEIRAFGGYIRNMFQVNRMHISKSILPVNCERGERVKSNLVLAESDYLDQQDHNVDIVLMDER